jgi:hypothetical protein
MDADEVREKTSPEEGKAEVPTNVSTSEGRLRPAQAPVTGVPGSGCGTLAGGPSNGSGMGNAQFTPSIPIPPPFVYALGRIEPRFPKLGVEKEFAQATGRTGTVSLTDGEALYKVLSQPENRYLSRQLCWVFTVEGLETYLLQPSCFGDFNLLVEAVRPGPRPTDVDVVIGTLGPMAPPEMCNGLMVPIVTFDQIYSFDVDSLMASIPRPEKVKKEERFEAACEDLFWRIMQMADNAGAMDEHRALNYLVVRYPAIFHTAAEAFNRNASLTAIEVQPSRLSGTRKVMQVIFSFTDRNTDVTDKSFCRVDVTEQWPFLVTKMCPYYDR